MTINTGVSPGLRAPATFHSFTYSFAKQPLTNLPLRMAIVGAKTATGTGTANAIYPVTDVASSDAIMGLQSEGAIMVRKAIETANRLGFGPQLYMVPLVELSGGTAAVNTITLVGSATADGPFSWSVAGRVFTIGVRSGDNVTTQASAMVKAMQANLENLPVIPTSSSGVTTLTHPTKGVNGNDIKISILQTVPGTVPTVAVGTAGAGAMEQQPALDALAALPFDIIALANHASADITEIVADIAARWSYTEKHWRYYSIGEMGTIGTATTLATAANHQAVLIASCEGCTSTAGEMSSALGVAAFSRSRPNASYNGMVLPLGPPPAATVYTPTERETAIAAGLTPLIGKVDVSSGTVADGVVMIVRMITTRTTNTTTSGTVPFLVVSDLAVSRTGIYIAQQIDVAYGARFSNDANPDGVLLTDDTEGQVEDMIEKVLRDSQDKSILKNVDQDVQNLKVEIDVGDGVIGRIDADVPYTVVVGLMQIAAIHRVQIQG